VAYLLSPGLGSTIWAQTQPVMQNRRAQEYWVIPIWFAVVTASSMFVGYILSSLFHLRQSRCVYVFVLYIMSAILPPRSFVTAAAMFMDSNSLPIALMQSLAFSDLAWGSADNEDAMLGRALTYLTMYSILGMVVCSFFSVLRAVICMTAFLTVYLRFCPASIQFWSHSAITSRHNSSTGRPVCKRCQ